jgi:predicted O-methyltransferase YrrM
MNWEGADVFEYGTGFSTVWWKNHGANLYGVEHNKNWYEKINGQQLGYITLENNVDNYPDSINIFDKQFDVVVIDGLVRYECVEPAVSNLKPGGIVIFDNSDWHRNTKELLDTKELIPIHFHGFKPTHVDSQTTSIYMHKEFSRKAKSIIPMGGTKRTPHMTDKPKGYQPKVGEIMQGRPEELEYKQ